MLEFEDQYPCIYIAGNTTTMQHIYFTQPISPQLLDLLLAQGWRKFGYNFFRPQCHDCRQCIPLRVEVANFQPSKKQRRLLRKNQEIRIEFRTLTYSNEIYQIYVDHCQRFPQEPLSSSSFIQSFFQSPCPGLQSEYYLDDELVAVGFLDQSEKALSSVYFIFKNRYQKYRLGVFSVLKEIEYCNELGLEYYYLGYYIKENQRMAYKDQFKPNLKMDWSNFEWQEHRIDEGS